MRDNEGIYNGYLGKFGMVMVYANRTQAEKAASRLADIGIDAFPVQSCQSMRFVVKVA